MKRFIFIGVKGFGQTFYVVTNNNSLIDGNYNSTYQLNVNNCDSAQLLYTCLPTNANDTNRDYEYYDMAIDTSGNVYYMSGIGGSLYTRKLNDSNSCEYLGTFAGDSDMQALACDVSGNVFAIGTNGYNSMTEFYEYLPKTKTFAHLGFLPVGYLSSGDIFYYEGRLFWTAYNTSSSTFLVEVNIKNPSQSCYYMNLGNINPWGAFSIQNGNCSDAYVVGNNGGSSFLYKLDLNSKTISVPICTYPFLVNGAASVYKFSPSIIDSNNCLPVDSVDCTSMPVTLLNFTSTLLNKTVQLQWQTTSEINSSYFLIERSVDGVNFSGIGKVNAAGNSTALKQYSFIDNAPLSINYYRLKEVDLDGKYVYSKILLVQMPQVNALNIIQNPVQNVLQLQIKNASAQTNYLSIFDFSGRRLKTFNAQNGVQNIDVSFLSSGTYMLQLITADGKAFVKSFVKR